ncbi:MAG TPA: DUF5050 domain-containing protein [Pyrinomonadaceae bacterium]
MSRSSKSLLLALSLLLAAILGCKSAVWKARVLADKQDHPSKIISDGASVYFVTGGTTASQNEGTNNINRIALQDGSVSVLVKGGEHLPSPTLAVDDKFLYWAEPGHIYRVPKAGGESELIVRDAPGQPDEMSVDEENIYWLVYGSTGSHNLPVLFAKKSGGPTQKLATGQEGYSGLCVDRDFVYWVGATGIRKIAKTGGTEELLYRNSSKGPMSDMVQDTDNLFYAQMDNHNDWVLMKIAKKGGEPAKLAPSISEVMQFVAGDKSIYYFERETSNTYLLRKISTGGGEPVTLDRGEDSWNKFLAVDNTQVYFTTIAKVLVVGK